MSTEPISGLPYQEANSMQTDAVQNAELNYITAWLNCVVESVGTNTPPASPVAGARYIVGTAPTGAWVGQAKALAVFRSGWQFYAPRAGVPVKDLATGNEYEYIGGAWVVAGGTFTGGDLTAALNEAKAADIASAATTDIGAVAGNYVHITGTTTITALGTAPAGARRVARFAGALTLTHNATSLILPTAANITTAANDVAVFVSEGAGNWRMTGYQRANGTPLAGASFTGGALTSALDEAKGADIASAATTNIAAATGNLVRITGTTTITAFGTAQAGTRRVLVFDGALVLTHNATSLILPTAANITTAAGDVVTMVSEGSGNWRAISYQRASGQALAGSGGGLTNFTEGVNTSTPNATIPYVSLNATNAATNVDVAIVPKGTGGFSFAVANNASSGGNKRGARSIDLQIYRGAQGQVASGADAVTLGYSNTASNAGCMAFGVGNTASGTTSMAWGRSHASDGFYSDTFGTGANARGISYACVWAGYQLGSQDGSIQDMRLMLSKSTTNATPAAATSDSSAAYNANQLTLPNNSAYLFKVLVVARQNTTGDTKSWEVTGHIKRGANAAATAMVAAATVTAIANDAGAAAWALAVTADTTNGCAKFEVTGEASKTIKWGVLVQHCLQVVG